MEMLIKAGDLDAIHDLLPKENLFGRWAEHPTLGRGIIISEHPDQEDFEWASVCHVLIGDRLEHGEND